ncbi:hypothetical protein KIN20_037989 [Parelaphostrongylus tenuis]|uniref:Uncharacterized protein n=1 Tax=Parelaphostrongylus tenuis TaxID=148309 RepID=A0AAD5RF46_PARTN|nr:hypothetical protein KIN20_037989 [Parelaphostrongylus tenuis]
MAVEYLKVTVPVAVAMAPFGSFIGSHFHRQVYSQQQKPHVASASTITMHKYFRKNFGSFLSQLLNEYAEELPSNKIARIRTSDLRIAATLQSSALPTELSTGVYEDSRALSENMICSSANLKLTSTFCAPHQSIPVTVDKSVGREEDCRMGIILRR